MLARHSCFALSLLTMGMLFLFSGCENGGPFSSKIQTTAAGTVVGDSAQPVEDVIVKVSGFEAYETTLTDAQGKFELNFATEEGANYEVRARSRKFWWQSEPVSISPGENRQNLVFIHPPIAYIFFSAFDEPALAGNEAFVSFPIDSDLLQGLYLTDSSQTYAFPGDTSLRFHISNGVRNFDTSLYLPPYDTTRFVVKY